MTRNIITRNQTPASNHSGFSIDAAELKFMSPTYGLLTFTDMCQKIAATISQIPDAKYTVMVGTDSHVHRKYETCFVTVVFVHRERKGGQFYYRRVRKFGITSLNQRMFYEASLSLAAAAHLTEILGGQGCHLHNVEIHADVGTNGDTKAIVKEIKTMIEAQGFISRIKPDAPAATKLADRFTR